MSDSERSEARNKFLLANGFNPAKICPLPGDASLRRYFRLKIKGNSYLLMDAPPGHENIISYIKVSEHLSSLGLNAPALFEKNLEQGFMIIEDFGDSTFTSLLDAGENPIPLYYDAIDALLHLHRHPMATALKIPAYDITALLDEAVLLIDWHWPAIMGKKCKKVIREAYLLAWREVFNNLPQIKNTLVLRDYHVGNLIHIQKNKGLMRLGILDFQDAVIGPAPYDLVSLVEDARRDNSQLSQRLLKRYFQSVNYEEWENFKRWYSVLGAHRHAKCAGIFIRLWRRDGKTAYLKYLSHVIRMLDSQLHTDDLAPVLAWFHEYYSKFKEVII